MYQFAADQVNSTAKLLPIFQNFQIRQCARVNEANITSEKGFNGYHFKIEGYHKFDHNKKFLFSVFLQISDPSFNP